MPLRTVTAENRVFNTFDNRGAAVGAVDGGVVNWFVHTLHVVGSGSVQNLTCVIDGWYKSAGQAETNLPAGMIITKMHVQVVGEPTVPLTIGGLRSYTVVPGDLNIEGDLVSAAQLKAALSTLPIGTEYWFKAEGTIPYNTTTPSLNGKIPSCVRHKDDASGSQFGWYKAANTTIVNGVDVAGAFTWNGTAPDLRNNGWSPTFVGNYAGGIDPVVEMFVGDSNTQGLQDNVARRTGRGWPQVMLLGDGTSSASTGIRSGSSYGISGDSGVSLTSATKILSKAKYHTDFVVATGANDIGQAGTGNATTTHNARISIKNSLLANAVGARTPKVIIPQLHPQSTTGNPTKTINSAPNTGWGVGEIASQTNDLAIAAVTATLLYAPTPSIRQGTIPSQTEYWLWKYKDPATLPTNVYDTALTPDGQHAGDLGVPLVASDVGSVYRTITAAVADTTPDVFTFVPATGAALNELKTSNTITVSGIDAAAAISITGGEYRIGSGGSWVTASGTVTNGQEVTVRRNASGTNSTTVNAVLAIGGVSGTFAVTTIALPGVSSKFTSNVLSLKTFSSRSLVSR